MFGMGFMEMMFIAVIAVIFLGPEKLPQAMVDIARFLKKAKATIADTKEDLERELHLSELKEEMLSYRQQLDEITNEVKSTATEAPKMLQEEIDDINKTIKEATTMPSLDAETKDAAIQEPTSPYHDEAEAVTFKKKKTPIEAAKPSDMTTEEVSTQEKKQEKKEKKKKKQSEVKKAEKPSAPESSEEA